MKASTVLTKHLARWGLKVTVRGVERKRKRGVVADVTEASNHGSGHVSGNGGGGSAERRNSTMTKGGGSRTTGSRGRMRRMIRGTGDGDGAGVYDDEVMFQASSSVSDDEEDEGSV